MAKKGKNQADFKPIGKALRKAIDDLKSIKVDRTGEVTRKQNAEVASHLGVLPASASAEGST